jgi:hypothetical protein
VTLLRQHKEVHKQCFPAQLLTLDKLVTGLEALKKQLQDAIAKRDQAQRDIQASHARRVYLTVATGACWLTGSLGDAIMLCRPKRWL